MNSPSVRTMCGLLLGLALLAAGCSRFPKGPDRPSFSPSSAAQGAMTLYDANQDGRLDAQELKKSPAIAAIVERADANKDGAVSLDELTVRMSTWVATNTIVTNATLYVTLNGQPLEGAAVTLTPDPCLGPSYQEATATTDSGGYCSPSVPGTQFPGVYLGAYLVKVSKTANGKESIPAKYNASSELGCEVATDIAGVGYIPIVLTSP